MSSLVPSNRRSLSRIDRQLAETLETIRANQRIASAGQIARIEIIEDVTQAALVATANISVWESMLADRVPNAEGRLRHIANAGAVGMTDVVLGVKRAVQ
jgi:hypothetical protein